MAATYVDTADSGRLSCTVDEIPLAERVVIGGVLVPLVGADEGLRYLGFQINGLCDWGDQAAIIRQIMHKYRTAVMPARLRKTETSYLYEAVLVPRLLYSLILASITDEELGKMESAMWMWQGRKLGLAPTQSRHLLHAEREWGGLGIESLSSRVVRRKAAMVMLWRSDAGGVMRSTYKAMRAAHDGALDSLVGPELGEVRAVIGQEPRFRATCEGLFYTGMHYALAANGLTW